MLTKCHQERKPTSQGNVLYRGPFKWSEWVTHTSSESAHISLLSFIYFSVQPFNKYLLRAHCIRHCAFVSNLSFMRFLKIERLKIILHCQLTWGFFVWVGSEDLKTNNLKSILRCGLVLIHMPFCASWIFFTVSLIFVIGSCTWILPESQRPEIVFCVLNYMYNMCRIILWPQPESCRLSH